MRIPGYESCSLGRITHTPEVKRQMQKGRDDRARMQRDGNGNRIRDTGEKTK